MTELIVLIVFVLGGLWILASAEGPEDPSFTHECDVNRLVKESLSKPKVNHHRYSSALVYQKP